MIRNAEATKSAKAAAEGAPPRRAVFLPFAGLVMAAGLAPTVAQAQNVTTAPSFFGYATGTLGTEAYGVSADGTRVLGGAAFNGANSAPFAWTSSGGFQTLALPTGFSSGQANFSTNDGSIMVGWGDYIFANNVYGNGIVWKNGTPSILAPLAGSNQSNVGKANLTGTIAVGLSQNGAIATATSWNLSTNAPTNLGTLTGQPFSVADAVNDAGTIVIGAAGTNGSSVHAELWNLSNNTVANLGVLTGGSSSVATAINSDGAFAAGWSHDSAGDQHAVLWNITGGQIVDLGVLAGGTSSLAMGISADGSVVIGDAGYSGDWTGLQATKVFRWTQSTGMQDLNTLLSGAGVNMTGITLQTANAISANGQFIVGRGVSPASGLAQAYIVRYIAGTSPAAPTPPSSPASPPPPATPIGGVTTPTSIQTSVDRLGIERRTAMIQAHGFLDQMLDEGRRIVEPDYAAAFGAAGSLAGGAAGRAHYGPVSLIMGLGAASESYSGASMNDAVIAAAKLRYVNMFNSTYGVFSDVGGFWSPSGSYDFSRTYANGAGTATGSGSTWGTQFYGFARVGPLIEATKDDELAPSVEIGRQSLQTSAYQETLSSANPFEAYAPGAFSGFDIFKARAQWSHKFDSGFDGTVWGAWGHGFAYSGGGIAIVDGVGPLSSQATGSVDWAEYGARVGYRFDANISASLFVNGVAGPAVGSKAHVGAAVQMTF